MPRPMKHSVELHNCTEISGWDLTICLLISKRWPINHLIIAVLLIQRDTDLSKPCPFLGSARCFGERSSKMRCPRWAKTCRSCRTLLPATARTRAIGRCLRLHSRALDKSMTNDRWQLVVMVVSLVWLKVFQWLSWSCLTDYGGCVRIKVHDKHHVHLSCLLARHQSSRGPCL